MEVGFSTLSSGAQHFHITAPDPHSSLVLAVPIAINDNSGVAHVLEHLLLTGETEPGVGSLFFRTRASSNAVDMNATTNSRYLAVHFTCDSAEEYSLLLHIFTRALFKPDWNNDQIAREIATITNEMEGALSDSSFYWQLTTYQSLFVEGSGQYNPGGDPSCIAEVNQNGLLRFWKDHFAPNNLIAVSYGSQSGELISEQLSLNLSQFNHSGGEKKIVPSRTTEAPRTLNVIDSSGRNLVGHSASALMLGSNPSEGAYFEIALINSFFNQYGGEILESLKQNGFQLAVPPSLKQIDGDSFLYVFFDRNGLTGSKNVWRQVADICEAVIKSLSTTELIQVVHEALENHFTLGNEKFGTGVAAAFELLNATCGSVTGSREQNSAIDIEAQIEKYQNDSSWISLIDKNIRMNGCQSLIMYDQSISAGELELFDSDSYTDTVLEEQGPTERRRKTKGPEEPNLSQNHQIKAPGDWLVPKVESKQQSRVLYYRLPRPWLSRVKLTIPLPNQLIEKVGRSNLFLLPESSALGARIHELEVSVGVCKVPGSSAYRLYLSLAASGNISKTRELLELFSSSLWRKGLGEVGYLSDKSSNVVNGSLPLHKLAIYRCASRLSEIAKVKLALAGYGQTASAAPPGWHMRADTNVSLDFQPKSLLFMDSVFEESELSLDKLDMETTLTDSSDFVDSPLSNQLANSDRQESIPGGLNYCARVWTLGPNFGIAAEEDAIPHIFSALATNLFLEPVIRGERSAYAASAEIDSELGMLVMFSYRDPNSSETDASFLEAFERIVSGDYASNAFAQSKKRAISRLHNKGSYDQRCEKQFDQFVYGYTQDYYNALRNSIESIEFTQFQANLPRIFESAITEQYAMIGRDGVTVA